MKLIRIFLFGVTLVITNTNVAWATYQRKDVIEFRGGIYDFGLFGNTPLEMYFRSHSRPKAFVACCSGCWRGHVASWKVIDGKLWLLQVFVVDNESSDRINPSRLTYKNYPLQKIFPNAGAAVFADWFTGTIWLNEGLHSFQSHRLRFVGGMCTNANEPIAISALSPIYCPSNKSHHTSDQVTTNQIPDMLEYQTETYLFGQQGVTPLTEYLKTHEVPKEFVCYSPESRRGHIAHWKVADDKLWLTLVLLCEEDGISYDLAWILAYKRLPLQKMFPDAGPVVFAKWFSGTIKSNRRVNGQSDMADNIALNFKEGRLISITRERQ